MRKYYVVLWMPTVIHTNFEWLYKESTDVFEISDGLTGDSLTHDDSALFAQICIKPGKDFSVSIFKDKEKKNRLENECFDLKYIDHSHNGLFKYELVKPDSGNALVKIDENGCASFPCDIYNKMKSFYHMHNYHAVDGGDSIIKPFISERDVDIKADNNAALKHYLCQYDAKFSYSFNLLSQLYEMLFKKKRIFVYVKLMLGMGKHGPFYQMATSIKGDKTYCNTLLNSYYNRFDQEGEDDVTEEQINEIKEARRRTFNIENITSSVSIMTERVNNHFSLSTSMISFWLACFAILLSVVFYFLAPSEGF